MSIEKEFDDTHLRMIRAACQHTEGKVSSAVVLQLFNEIDELRAAMKECRNATLEEAAQVCMGIALKPSNVILGVAVDCAKEIRSMK
jgi:hypothetical protein